MLTAFFFIALSYAIGFLVMMTPIIYLEYLGKTENLRSEFCTASPIIKDQVATVTLVSALSMVFLFLVIFKLKQPAGLRNLWFSIKCHYWWPNIVFAGSLVVYQFSQSLIMTLFVFPLIQVASSLRVKPIMTMLMVTSFMSLTIVILFGTMITHPSNYGLQGTSVFGMAGDLVQMVTREAILDY